MIYTWIVRVKYIRNLEKFLTQNTPTESPTWLEDR